MFSNTWLTQQQVATGKYSFPCTSPRSLNPWLRVSYLRPSAPIYSCLTHPIQNSVIRICTGAFRTSPQLSLCADSGTPPPLHYRRLFLTAGLFLFHPLPNTEVHQLLFKRTITTKPSHRCQGLSNIHSLRKSDFTASPQSSFHSTIGLASTYILLI